MSKIAAIVCFYYVKNSVKIKLKKIEVDPQKLIGKSYGKREDKVPLGRKLQGFSDNGIQAMAI